MLGATSHDIAICVRDLSSGDLQTEATAFHRLIAGLTELCDCLPPAEWEAAILSLRNSALLPILLQEPLTRRSFFHQGGQPSDGGADRLDPMDDAVPASDLGQRLHALLLARPFLQASRHLSRRSSDFLAEAAAERPNPRILMFTSGHILDIDPDLARRISPGLVVLEDDPAALHGLSRRFPGARCLQGRPAALLEGLVDDEVFDASISPAVYNTLPDVLAARLLARNLCLLREGGRVMISNFVRDAVDRGYLEAFLDWKYIYRDETDMARLVSLAGVSCATRLYREPSGQILFLELTKTEDSLNKG